MGVGKNECLGFVLCGGKYASWSLVGEGGKKNESWYFNLWGKVAVLIFYFVEGKLVCSSFILWVKMSQSICKPLEVTKIIILMLTMTELVWKYTSKWGENMSFSLGS